jgi:hypothetical protein
MGHGFAGWPRSTVCPSVMTEEPVPHARPQGLTSRIRIRRKTEIPAAHQFIAKWIHNNGTTALQRVIAVVDPPLRRAHNEKRYANDTSSQ